MEYGNHLSSFQSKTIDVYKYIGEIKMDMNMLGMKPNVKLGQGQVFVIDMFPSFGLSSLASIKKHFQEIYEEITYMQKDLDTLFEYSGV